MPNQGLILHGTKKVGSFGTYKQLRMGIEEIVTSDTIMGGEVILGIRILNQHIDIASSCTNKPLHFLIADTGDDPNDDGNWVQIHKIEKNLGTGILLGTGLFVSDICSTFKMGHVVRKDQDAN